jgi:hypothetical protein
MLIEPNRPS